MILDIVKSVNDVSIRLTDERWEHILNQHPYMSGFYNEILKATEKPEFITRGNRGAKIAVVNLGRRRWLHVMYRELNQADGFIITSFIDEYYEQSKVIWSQQN